MTKSVPLEPLRMTYERMDAHFHVWDLGQRDQPWIDGLGMTGIKQNFDLDQLAAERAGTNVTSGILVQVLNIVAETDEMLALARACDHVAGVVGWLDLARQDLAEQVERLRAGGPLVGVRHQMQAEADPGEWLQRPDVQASLASLGEIGLPCDLMLYPADLELAAATVHRHPSTVFVVDHIGKPDVADGQFQSWASGLGGIAEAPNAFCKLSGITTLSGHDEWSVDQIRSYVDYVLEAFGPDRVMFGSDWPLCRLTASYPQVVAGVEQLIESLSASEKESVWAGTARKVYGVA